jgi:poly-gamma-glutamate capsule biosynthesis protein CapA/YwtB (metallophosphatase superfamily)
MNKLPLAVAVLGFMFLAEYEPTGRIVTLALLGDLMVGRGLDPTPASLAYLAPNLKAADLSLANLESPLSSSPAHPTAKGGYDLCASAPRAALFPLWGLDMLSLANNHRFDCGDDRVGDTIRAVSGAGLVPVGPGPEPVYRELNGLKLAFVAFDDVLSPIEAAAAARRIREAGARGAVVIVSVHWGMEYQEGVTERQKYLARQFAGAGAALIVGTHPHVLQRAEWVQGPSSAAGVQSGPRPGTLVLYSLGNALFDQGGLADTRRSALVVVTLDEQGVKSVRVVPFALHVAESRVLAPDEETPKIIRDQLNLP